MTITTWQIDPEKLRNSFTRFVLPLAWDYAEGNPFVDSSGGFVQAIEWVGEVVDHNLKATAKSVPSKSLYDSAINAELSDIDIILTDPPYYDAIPYSDLMDFFHVWLRRTLYGLSTDFDSAFSEPLGPKWSPL